MQRYGTVDVASGRIGPAPDMDKKATDCLHSAGGFIYAVHIHGRLRHLCKTCYDLWRKGHEVVIHDRR